MELILFRKNSDFIDIGNFEVWIRPYCFATAVFTKLGSMLSGTSREGQINQIYIKLHILQIHFFADSYD